MRDVSSDPPIGPWDKANRELWTDIERADYVGTLLSIQVVAPKLQEQSLVNAMSVINEAVKAHMHREGGKGRLQVSKTSHL